MNDPAGTATSSGRSIGHLCAVAVRAPFQVAREVTALVPRLARAGAGHLAVARHLGRFALGRDDPAVDRPGDPARARARSTARSLGLVPSGEEDSAPAPAPSADEDRAATAATATASGPDASDAAPPPAPATGEGEGPTAALAIPDYESLSASQVVPRLDGLSSEELVAVQRFEEAHRRRRTILSKIAQLQAR